MTLPVSLSVCAPTSAITSPHRRGARLLVQLGRQEALDHLDLARLAIGHLQLPARLVALDAFAALRDHGLEHAHQLLVGQALGVTLGASFLVALLQCHMDQPHDRHRASIIGFRGIRAALR